jgi:hypothetical protein
MGSAAAMTATAAQIRCNGAPLHVYVLVSRVEVFELQFHLLRTAHANAKAKPADTTKKLSPIDRLILITRHTLPCASEEERRTETYMTQPLL